MHMVAFIEWKVPTCVRRKLEDGLGETDEEKDVMTEIGWHAEK